jgi:hypothetical protein
LRPVPSRPLKAAEIVTLRIGRYEASCGAALSEGRAAPASSPEPIPIRGNLSVTVDHSGAALVVLKLALYLETDDALDLCLRTISTVARIKRTPLTP